MCLFVQGRGEVRERAEEDGGSADVLAPDEKPRTGERERQRQREAETGRETERERERERERAERERESEGERKERGKVG